MNKKRQSGLQPAPRLALKRFPMVFLPAMVFVGVITALFYRMGYRSDMTVLEVEEASAVEMQVETMTVLLESITSDLLILAGHHELKELLNSDAAGDRRALTEEFLLFSKTKGLYDQVRYIDETGMEAVRVNYRDGDPYVVSQEELQPKADRYYFKEAMGLGPGEVYVSPLDLNIEHGRVEEPVKSIIRFATPLFDHGGRRRGTIVLNYLGGELFGHLRTRAIGTSGDFMLINPEGYWLLGPSPADEWGFMYEERKDRTFGKLYPGAWQRINEARGGQFHTPQGIFTFKTVHLFAQGRSDGSGNETIAETGAYYWKTVSHVSEETLLAITHRSLLRYFLFYAGAGGVIAAGALFYAYAASRREAAEKALRESEERFRKFFENEPSYCYMVSLDGTIIDVNGSALKALGYKKDELLGRPLKTVYTPEALPRLKELFDKWTRTNELSGEEMEIVTKSGERRTVLLSAGAVEGADGSVLHSVCVQIDITERKKAEVKFERIFNLSPDLICIASSADGYFKRLNPAWEALLGYTREELLSRPLLEFIHYDDRGPTIAEVERQLRGQSTICFENRYRCLDGSYKILEWKAHAVEGGLIYGAARDITDRRHAEEALQALVASSVGSIGQECFERIVSNLGRWLDVDCVIIGEIIDGGTVKVLSMRLDGASVEGFSYALSGTPCEHVLKNGFYAHPEGAARFFPDDEELVRIGADGYVGVSLRDGDGNAIGVLCAISRRVMELPPETKGVLEIIAARASVEIERKKAEEALDAKAMELDRTNKDLHNLAMEMTKLEERERKRFAGVLHDDIGQNLVATKLALASFTKLCDQSTDDAMETMADINSLLDGTISNIRSMVSNLYHTHPYGEELVNKKGLVNAIRWYAEDILGTAGVKAAVDIDRVVEELPEDFKQNLYRILQECLQNVMKHSRASNVELRCELDKECLKVYVKDNGVGFDDIRLKEGGVGLRLMRERVRTMNGILTIRSEPGIGTEVFAEFSKVVETPMERRTGGT